MMGLTFHPRGAPRSKIGRHRPGQLERRFDLGTTHTDAPARRSARGTRHRLSEKVRVLASRMGGGR